MLGGVVDDVRVNDRLTIPAAELAWRFSRSSGPGGQGVNTTDSRVELSWDLGGSALLPPMLKERAAERLGHRLVRVC
jgi:ribosome-associated protein